MITNSTSLVDSPLTSYQVRFQLPDGGWSDWLVVSLEVTEVTDPDFNGDDCPCTWREASGSIEVPPEAQLDASASN